MSAVALRALPAWLEAEFEFPVERATVVEAAGDLVVAAPDPKAAETLATILDRGGDERYRTPADLRAAVRGNVSEAYVGRKFYDDRGAAPGDDPRRPTADSL